MNKYLHGMLTYSNTTSSVIGAATSKFKYLPLDIRDTFQEIVPFNSAKRLCSSGSYVAFMPRNQITTKSFMVFSAPLTLYQDTKEGDIGWGRLCAFLDPI